MIDRNKYESLADALASVDDLEEVKRAVVRESAIRGAMKDTGEDRQTVTETMDAMEATGQEAVLDLTEGEPTTLADALDRYVDELKKRDELQPRDLITSELTAILAYPWTTVLDVEGLTREIHEAYVRLAPGFGVEVELWDDLEEYQRELARAVVENVAARGALVIAKPAQTAQDGPAAGACPTCGASGGFHDGGPHSAASAVIPPHLKRPSNSVIRRERRTR